MPPKLFHYGAYRSCPVCGKQFFVSELGSWAYTRYIPGDGKKTGAKKEKAWFCSWSCLKKWDNWNENPRKRKKKKQTGA